MVSWTEIAVSWGIFGGVIVFGIWYYGPGSRRRRGSVLPLPKILFQERADRNSANSKVKQRRKDRDREQDSSEVPLSDASEVHASVAKDSDSGVNGHLQDRKKGKKQRFVPLAESSAVQVSPATARQLANNDDDDTSAREFARQMSKTQAGTTLSSVQKATQRVRTQKQSKVNGIQGNFEFAETVDSGTSSLTGADADDDLSPAVSPPLGATSAAADTTGVSDMLESPEPGPSSLRITEPTKPQRAPQPAKVKSTEALETKKQRQARARREREKAVRDEIEAQRKVMAEGQRRTAREAEGRPAKNGNGWTYASGLPANSWTQNAPAPQVAKTTTDSALLDTGDDTSKVPAGQSTVSNAPSAATSKNAATPTPNALAASNGKDVSETSSTSTSSQWENGLPSEEEQLRMFKEQSDDADWTTVPAGKRAKRRPTNDQAEKPPGLQKDLPDFDVQI